MKHRDTNRRRIVAVRHQNNRPKDPSTHVLEVQDPLNPDQWSAELYASEAECLLYKALLKGLTRASATYRVRPTSARYQKKLTREELIAELKGVA